MDKIQKQRSSIVLYREKGNGERYIRIKYTDNPAIALLLSRESGIQMADNASAYITVTAFKLPDFSDRSSPYAYIDYSRTDVRAASQFTTDIHVTGRLSETTESHLTRRCQRTDTGTHHGQELLGYNNIKMTNIYLHVTNALKSSIPNPLDMLDDL